MIRQQAFGGKEKMLKGALHCHTTLSDGEISPEEVIRLYHRMNYDFLAITDHRRYNYLNYAPEVPITIIPGMEFDNPIERGHGFRTYHTVCIGHTQEDGNGFKQDEVLEQGTAKNQEEYQSYLDEIHEKGNLTIYAHPEWSSTSARYFENQKGNFAMEVWNSACALDLDLNQDAPYWDEILGQGKIIYGVAADDTHNITHAGNGWVMVRAENNIPSILKALEEGKFYSSCGPEIYDFYVDGDLVVLECSEVVRVRFLSDMHPTRVFKSTDTPFTRVEFDLKTWVPNYQYIRATVIDKDGKYAWTNPIFLK